MGGIVNYGVLTIEAYGYRVSSTKGSGSDLIWTIDSNNKGGSNGLNSLPIQCVYGLIKKPL